MSKICWSDSLRDDPTAETLSSALEQGRLGHALLMVAPAVSVADAAARALAAGLLGHSLPHADFVSVAPEGKLRQIKVDPMREMRLFLQKASLTGVKVAHISECERLNDEAANLFLKILEEPPADTTIILTSSQPHAILPTILSRAMRFRWLGAAQEREEFAPFAAAFKAFLLEPAASATVAEVQKMAFLATWFSLWQGPEAKSEKSADAPALSEEAKEALEAAQKKEHRLAMLATMEGVVLDVYKSAPREGVALTRALASLERVRRLLEFSFNEAAAFELAVAKGFSH